MRPYFFETGALQELFYQIKGDMRLDIIEGGKLRQIPIKEGEMFLLPGRVPHSPQVKHQFSFGRWRLSAPLTYPSCVSCPATPQRFANTVGLVIERVRSDKEMDGLRWYTKDFSQILYEEWFHCDDLGVQLVPVIERFRASDAFKTGVPAGPPGPPQVRQQTRARRERAGTNPGNRCSEPTLPMDFNCSLHRSRSTTMCGPRRRSTLTECSAAWRRRRRARR